MAQQLSPELLASKSLCLLLRGEGELVADGKLLSHAIASTRSHLESSSLLKYTLALHQFPFLTWR